MNAGRLARSARARAWGPGYRCALALAVMLGLGGCALDAGAGLDGATSPLDASIPYADDGGVALDAGVSLDAEVAPDASSSPPDAGGASDAGVDGGSSMGVPCIALGLPGTCQTTATCTGMMMPVAGYCPGAADIQCCVAESTSDRCEATDVPLPNATFMVEPAGVGGCPAGMALVAGFCMDRWEASIAEVDATGALVPWSPYFNPGARVVRALSVPGAVPQGYINRYQAENACTEAGKRLCTSEEWLRACQGSPATTFPYGNTRIWDVCNDRRSVHPAVEYFETSASWIYSEIDHSCLNQLPDSLALAGSHTGCISDEGIFDLVGNLHEWTEGTPSAGRGVFRGGFYVDTVLNGQGCLYRTTAHAPSHWDYSTGFRCCADVP